ncbi:MAG: hypothetical protein V1837_07205 [Candidatus Woesearchaeota archaeon]
MFGKKGDGVLWEQILYAVLVVVAIAVMLYIFGPNAARASTSFNKYFNQAELTQCALKGSNDKDRIELYCNPNNKDYPYPVSCDPCLGATNTYDMDGDGMPDQCEKDKGQDVKKTECLHVNKAKKTQCCMTTTPCNNLKAVTITCT